MNATFPFDAIAFSADEELAAYRSMLLIRRFEEKAGQLYALGAIGGICELSIGREAAITGLLLAARADDPIVAGRRCHGLLLARGLDPAQIMGELLGRVTGYMSGCAGGREIVSQAQNVLGGHGTPGAQASVAAGVALGLKHAGRGGVCLAILDDGAHATGTAHESLLLARRLSLPVLFVIDQNMGFETSTHGLDAASAGLAGERVDGIDVRKVKVAAERILAGVRETGVPAVLEIMTHAFRGHSAPATAKLQSAEHRREETDPLLKARTRILAHEFATEAELRDLEKTARDAVTAAAAAGKAAALADAAAWTQSGALMSGTPIHDGGRRV